MAEYDRPSGFTSKGFHLEVSINLDIQHDYI